MDIMAQTRRHHRYHHPISMVAWPIASDVALSLPLVR
jgi:hypothetical protein